MRAPTVHVAFGSRFELTRLDDLATQLGGRRVATEWRPCYARSRKDDRPHTATYAFKHDGEARAFARLRARV